MYGPYAQDNALCSDWSLRVARQICIEYCHRDHSVRCRGLELISTRAEIDIVRIAVLFIPSPSSSCMLELVAAKIV